MQTGIRYRIEPAPAAGPEPPVESKPRARKRVKGSPTAAQSRDIRKRFFTGTRVYSAVLGEFIARSRAVKVRAFDAVQRWHVRRCRSPTGPGTAIADATA